MAQTSVKVVGDLAKARGLQGDNAPMYTIWTNFGQVANELKILQNAVTLNWVKIMKKACDEILVKKAKIRLRKLIAGYKRTIKSKRTGNLVKGIHCIVKSAMFTNVEIWFGNSVSYGIYFEKGTGVYGPKMKYIKPIKKRILAWQSAGQWYFAKQVAGMPPRPYLLPTAQQEWGNLLVFLLASILTILQSRKNVTKYGPIMKRHK